MAAPTIRKAMETSSAGQYGKGSIHSLSLRQSQAQTQNRAPTAMAADAAAVHAVYSRVPGPVERRRYRRPVISSRTGMSPHEGSAKSPRAIPAIASQEEGDHRPPGSSKPATMLNAMAQGTAPSRDQVATRVTQRVLAGIRLQARRGDQTGTGLTTRTHSQSQSQSQS